MKEQTMKQLELFEAKQIVEFKKYHKENPHIYQQFVRFTIEAIESGYKHFGSQMIIEHIRWETGVKAKNSEFKINNNAAPFYSRYFMLQYPNYANYFRTRTSIADAMTLKEFE